jgi:hypothetical protein
VDGDLLGNAVGLDDGRDDGSVDGNLLGNAIGLYDG